MKTLLFASALASALLLSGAPYGASLASAGTIDARPAVYGSTAPAAVTPVYWRRYRANRPYYYGAPYNYGYYGAPYSYGTYYRPYYGGYYGYRPYYNNYYYGPARPYGAWRGQRAYW
jgi:hypothetical protein